MIQNERAVFPHINSYQLKAATKEIGQKMGGQGLMIMVTASQNSAIVAAQKSKTKAKIEHVKLAVLGHFPDGKALNPDDAKLIRTTAAILSKYAELELSEEGFLQVKGAPKMVDAAIKVQPKAVPAKAEPIETEQPETEKPENKKKGKKADKTEQNETVNP